MYPNRYCGVGFARMPGNFASALIVFGLPVDVPARDFLQR
jgi:hypothetical protein